MLQHKCPSFGQGCIRSVTHLEEALKGVETDARAYGTSGVGNKRKWSRNKAKEAANKVTRVDEDESQVLKVVVNDLSSGLEPVWNALSIRINQNVVSKLRREISFVFFLRQPIALVGSS